MQNHVYKICSFIFGILSIYVMRYLLQQFDCPDYGTKMLATLFSMFGIILLVQLFVVCTDIDRNRMEQNK